LISLRKIVAIEAIPATKQKIIMGQGAGTSAI
jgi:hypothetical protein